MKKVSFALNIFFVGFFFWYFGCHIGFNYYVDRFFKHREFFRAEPYYQAKVKAYHELNNFLDKEKKYIVIVGDSLVEQFPVDELFTDFQVINRGIGKDTSHGLLDRIDDTINTINISSCFVMIGHNDIKYRSCRETVGYIKKILSKIEAENIFFLSVLPDNIPGDNEIFFQINKDIKEYCTGNPCTFVDVYSKFCEDNFLYKRQYYYDGVHLNIRGYRKLAGDVNKIIMADAGN